MDYDQLIEFAKDAIKQFEADMDIADKNNMANDYNYAEGARNAYKVILNCLDAQDAEEDEEN